METGQQNDPGLQNTMSPESANQNNENTPPPPPGHELIPGEKPPAKDEPKKEIPEMATLSEWKILESDKTKKECTLPSGAHAVMTRFMGKHFRELSKYIDGNSIEVDNTIAIVALTTTIDGNQVTPHDVLDMDGWDVMELCAEAMKMRFR